MLKYLSPLHKANRQISLYFEEHMEGYEISPVEGHMLGYLGAYAPCPISELVRVFGLKQSTMTSMLDRLEQHGFVTRAVNPDDRRSFLVNITTAGRQMSDRLNEMIARFEEDLDARIGERDLKGFQNVMAAVGDATKVDVRGGGGGTR